MRVMYVLSDLSYDKLKKDKFIYASTSPIWSKCMTVKSITMKLQQKYKILPFGLMKPIAHTTLYAGYATLCTSRLMYHGLTDIGDREEDLAC